MTQTIKDRIHYA